MAVARSAIVLAGTSETSGDTITNNSTDSAAEVDVLGNDTSSGYLKLYLVYTGSVTAGSIDIKVNPRRVTGTAYKARASQFSVTPVSGTLTPVFLGIVDASRYMQCDVLNNATGGTLTNVSVLAELFKVS